MLSTFGQDSPSFFRPLKSNWLVLSDEQMSKRWPFSLLNDEQMSNWVGVKHLPGNLLKIDGLEDGIF